MSDKFIIRPVAPADRDQWLRLWEAYNAFYGRSGETALPSEITDKSWSRFFDVGEPMHAVVAEAEGRLLGLAHFLYHRSTTALMPSCYLQDLYTAPEERGRGIARSLISAVCEQARLKSANRVYWQTHEKNLAARKLYDKVGEHAGFIVYRILL